MGKTVDQLDPVQSLNESQKVIVDDGTKTWSGIIGQIKSFIIGLLKINNKGFVNDSIDLTLDDIGVGSTNKHLTTAEKNKVALIKSDQGTSNFLNGAGQYTEPADGGASGPPVALTYTSYALLKVDQGNQANKYLYHVVGGGVNVTLKYKGTTAGVLKSDYELIGATVTQQPYANKTARNADQANQWPGLVHYVTGDDNEIEAYFEYLGTTNGDDTDYRGGGVTEEIIPIHLSAFGADITQGSNKGYWTALWPCKARSVRGVCEAGAPTGSSAILDLNKEGVTMMTNNKIEIEAGNKNSKDSATQPVFTTDDIVEGDTITGDIDSIGSANPGKGGVIYLTVTR